ncbi:MAG: YihY/virulence factor BrkB family protein [Solirubrobacterales bacterium]|nr:YihY/virulence factor BrkB family protein [Solirubrobacterales bacterium]
MTTTTSPTDLREDDWKAALKRTFKGISGDNLTDWAAALTYYGVQAMFPALLALISIVGLLGRSTTDSLIGNVRAAAPGPARDIVVPAIQNLQSNSGAAGIMLIVGIVIALFSASSYIGAFARASNAIYEMPEGRPVWKLRPQQMGIAFVMIVLLALSALAVVVTGGLARQVGKVVGLGDTAVTVWDIAKWPVLLLVVSFMFAFLYWAAPNVKQPKFRWLSPGGILAVVVWMIASAAFALYVANFASYNKTYGSLGGVIAFLVWLWLTNLAMLLGAEMNAELARGKAQEEGRRTIRDDEPILPPRDTAKLDDDDPLKRA